jgi:hypothetical protein
MDNRVFVLLDASGSMQTMWEEALSGINSYVEKLEDTQVLVAAFSTAEYKILRNGSSDEWERITSKEISPNGGTPLLDAAGRIIWHMFDSLADRAVLVVVTDGEENSSSRFKAAEIKTLVRQLTNEKNYDIVFLGANFDKVGDVATHSFGMLDSSRFINNDRGQFVATMSMTADKTRAYFGTGAKAQAFYSDAEKAKASK